MDEEEFTPEMRRIRDWEWILQLDPSYKHGTMIACLNETVHGNRFSIVTCKTYRNITRARMESSIRVSEEQAKKLFDDIVEKILLMQARWPLRVSSNECVEIRPKGRVCVYVMDRITYNHEN